MPTVHRVELWVNPNSHLFAVRKAPNGSRYSLEWSRKNSDHLYPRTIGGSAFLPTLYKLFGWRKDSNYRINGTAYRSGEETIIIFNAHDAVLFIAQDMLEEAQGQDITETEPTDGKKKNKKIIAYPSKWADNFGDSYYKSKALTAEASENPEWTAAANDTVYIYIYVHTHT